MQKTIIVSINRLFDLITVEYSRPCPSARFIARCEARIDQLLSDLADVQE